MGRLVYTDAQREEAAQWPSSGQNKTTPTARFTAHYTPQGSFTANVPIWVVWSIALRY